jgi:hypothetical protein
MLLSILGGPMYYNQESMKERIKLEYTHVYNMFSNYIF